MQKAFSEDIGLGEEDKWYGTCDYQPEGKRDEDAKLMIEHFEESGHRYSEVSVRSAEES